MALQSQRMSHRQDESEMPRLDQFTLRFPDLTEKILSQLDNEHLEKFKIDIYIKKIKRWLVNLNRCLLDKRN